MTRFFTNYRLTARLLMASLILGIALGCKDKNQDHSQLQIGDGSLQNEEYSALNAEFRKVKGKGILFGHQDDLAYGIDWKYVKGNSDVKRIAGDYPALFGWELGGIERNDPMNLDSVPFDRMRDLVAKANDMGGVNTFSWHPYEPIEGRSSWTRDAKIVSHLLPGGSHHAQFVEQLDRLAVFLSSLKSSDGSKIPFIFRPWHEMDGSWFWWGSDHCTPEEFRQLFSFTVEYLRSEKGIDQMLVAYSPDRNFKTAEEYLTWYPGDQHVDILGVDNYHDLKQAGGHELAIEKLHVVIDLAKQKDKLAAFTETGLENVTKADWYEAHLGKVLSDSLVRNEISYVMVWRNDPDVHFFFPFPGHPGELSAKRLLARPEILLVQEFNDLKQESKK